MSVSRETLSFPSFLNRFQTICDKARLWDEGFVVGPRPFLGLFLLAQYQTRDRILVRCSTSQLAEDCYRFCFNFLESGVCWFPENQKEENDVIGFMAEQERFQSEAYNLAARKEKYLLFSTPSALESAVSAPSGGLPSGFRLAADAQVSKERLIGSLINWGYDHQDRVLFPKTFSSRGGILDVFLPYSTYPVRLEFFGNTIESIRTFSPLTQRKVSSLDFVEILPPPEPEPDKNKMSFGSLLGDSLSLCLEPADENKFLLYSQDVNKDDVLYKSNYNISLYVDRGEPVSGFPPSRLFAFSDDPYSDDRFLEKSGFAGSIVSGILEEGFYSKDIGVCCLSVAQMLHQQSRTNYRWSLDSYSYTPQETLSTIDDISWGDFLVHQDFGVGLYRGLETIKQNDSEQECIKIEYADNGVVYVPVDKFSKVHKLIASGKSTPVLSSLGSRKWSQQKERVKKSAQVVVQDLIQLYANRNRPRGFVYETNDDFYRAVVASFPYDETPDQQQAIRDVLMDMEKDRPVDRLVCGDVGFGKTEVAIRAAVKAVSSGKKVLLLTPTTILADQHFISFSSRLDPLGIHVALLSRFRTKKEQTEILEKMFIGAVDVVVGTHRLLSQDIHFPELGLLIIDEEHRFGVKHKERLKQLKQAVDVIALTATPIPRTLQQSLVGLREISKIQTPPKTRKPIHTYVKFFDWSLVERVLSTELQRRGQVYFLHNDIDSLPFYYRELVSRFPSASIAIAHGKMNSKELEKVVLAFFKKEIDVLLCTTIIESGLDVSNANTIIINQAHRFGLAQLYQIRGRVGRSYRQAYCYLLLPKDITLGEEAYQRLKAIEQYTSLGSGFDIAMKDLEIRGAGNLFGYKQSGNIATVGFEMYCRILKEAIDEKMVNASEPIQQAKIIARQTTLIDNVYVPHAHDRLFFYKRFSEAGSLGEVDDISDELADRFGPLPKTAHDLIQIAKLRVLFTGTSIGRVHLNKQLRLALNSFAPFNSAAEMLENVSNRLSLEKHPYRVIPDGKKNTMEIVVETGNFDAAVNVATILGRLFSSHNP